MNDDPLNRYLDEFGRRLDEAAAHSPRRPSGRSALAAAILAAMIAGIVAVLVLVPGGDGRFDVVAKARAALADRGQVVHLVARGWLLPDRPRHTESPTHLQSFRWEQWSTGSPPRWRIESTIHRDTLQLAYGHRSLSAYYGNRLQVRRGPSSKFASDLPLPIRVLFGGAARDPIARIRGMLRSGELHDDGSAEVGGRDVRRLIGALPIYTKLPRRLAEVRYFVDPETYAPVAARLVLPPPRHGGASMRIHISFESFERLALTPQNADLLKIQPHGKPTVTSRAPGTIVLRPRGGN